MLVAEPLPRLVAQDAIGTYPEPVRSCDRYTGIESSLWSIEHIRAIVELDIICEIVDDMNFVRVVVILVGAFVSARYVDSVFTNAETSRYDCMAKP